MYVFWPSSVMLVVGWRTTILGIMITALSVVINYLRKEFFNTVITLTTRSVSEIVLELVGRLHHFTSARQLESSAWICSVRR
jgi:hypothetical protein